MAKLMAKKQAKKKTSGGPGKKNCPGCREYIGARCKVCPLCNYNYETGLKEEVKAAPTHFLRPRNVITSEAWPNSLGIVADGIRKYKVSLPSGKCPVDLKDITPAKVKKWADAVSDRMAEKNQLMTPEALFYFALHFEPNKEEKKIIQKVLGVN